MAETAEHRFAQGDAVPPAACEYDSADAGLYKTVFEFADSIAQRRETFGDPINSLILEWRCPLAQPQAA